MDKQAITQREQFLKQQRTKNFYDWQHCVHALVYLPDKKPVARGGKENSPGRKFLYKAFKKYANKNHYIEAKKRREIMKLRETNKRLYGPKQT